MGKVLGILILTFLLGTLFKILGWSFPPYLLIGSALGVSIALMIETLLMQEKSALKAARNLAVSASFLVGVASTFFVDFQNPLLIVSGSFFLLFLGLAVADILISRDWKNRYIMFAGATALVGMAWFLKKNQLQFAEEALILAIILALAWVVMEYFFTHSAPSGDQKR